MHYTLDLDLDIAAGSILEATATIDAVATQDLSAFNLDYRGPEIDAVAGRRRAGGLVAGGGELTVTPAASDRQLASLSDRRALPRPPERRRGPLRARLVGDREFDLHGREPAGADVWYPVNGHPLDKATYTLGDHRARAVRRGRPTGCWSVAMASGADGQPLDGTFTWENASRRPAIWSSSTPPSWNRDRHGSGRHHADRGVPAGSPRADERLLRPRAGDDRDLTKLFGPYPFASTRRHGLRGHARSTPRWRRRA